MAKKAKKSAKKAAKKAPSKKVKTAKKAVMKVAAKKKMPMPTSAVSGKPMTKTQIFTEIAEVTGIPRKDVSMVFESLAMVIERHVKKKAVGNFILPGLLKIKAIKRPARAAKKNVPNPFKPGELMDVPARPASMKVKVLPLKKLKEMVL